MNHQVIEIRRGQISLSALQDVIKKDGVVGSGTGTSSSPLPQLQHIQQTSHCILWQPRGNDKSVGEQCGKRINARIHIIGRNCFARWVDKEIDHEVETAWSSGKKQEARFEENDEGYKGRTNHCEHKKPYMKK